MAKIRRTKRWRSLGGAVQQRGATPSPITHWWGRKISQKKRPPAKSLGVKFFRQPGEHHPCRPSAFYALWQRILPQQCLFGTKLPMISTLDDICWKWSKRASSTSIVASLWRSWRRRTAPQLIFERCRRRPSFAPFTSRATSGVTAGPRVEGLATTQRGQRSFCRHLPKEWAFGPGRLAI